jgi:ubiquinone biosynthesis protein UbiJ
MITLLPALRDFINLKIENRPELWDTLKKFQNAVIQVCFTDQPLKKYFLVFHVDTDGLLKSSAIKSCNEPDAEELQTMSEQPDIIINIDNAYIKNIGEEFVGWTFDFSKQDLPDPNVFTNGLKIEGDANTIQELAPLLKLIMDDLSPLATLLKKSPFNYAAKSLVEYMLKKERLLVLQDDFDGFVKGVRSFRSDIERTQKKLEVLDEILST